MNIKPFSIELQAKIHLLMKYRRPIKLGEVEMSSKLVLAPMAQITHLPFRLLMGQLGAGMGISELVSAKGINYKNDKTLHMLSTSKDETTKGLQLFGEEIPAMIEAATVAESYAPEFIDINMGCPVNKVTKKGGGSALLKRTEGLSDLFSEMRKSINIPLSIKIRTGWDETCRNALDICQIAYDSGVEFVSVHGRTRSQLYKGLADWDFLENLAKDSALPILGNGDLVNPGMIYQKSLSTNCHALMIGRGALKNPFIFLESLVHESERKEVIFTPRDFLEIYFHYYDYLAQHFDWEPKIMITLKKQIMWWSYGLTNASHFREKVFPCKNLEELHDLVGNYFESFSSDPYLFRQKLHFDQSFMTAGHG
ncbi:tRNA-dihydrouridine synthase [Bacteriovoracaceae bacterium]|nr:tRNA-dihydrouridine synthase [Bacteriovoracaceae bacterium]